jgi:hypothetical protein
MWLLNVPPALTYQHSEYLPHSVYLCDPYGSHNKQRLFPQTALTSWALLRRRNVFPVGCEMDLCTFRRNSIFKDEGIAWLPE